MGRNSRGKAMLAIALLHLGSEEAQPPAKSHNDTHKKSCLTVCSAGFGIITLVSPFPKKITLVAKGNNLNFAKN